MRIRALLFDYGGTLDGDGHWCARFAQLYREAGTEIAPRALRRAFDQAEEALHTNPAVRSATLRDVIDLHVRMQLAALDLHRPDLQRALAGRFLADSEAALARNGRLLAQLAPDFSLGVVSNFYGNVRRILADAGLASFLSVIVDSGIVGVAKPDPRIFAHALNGLGSAAGDTLHVGDSYERDVLAARAAGLRTAWLTADPVAASSCAADIRLHSLGDLPHALATFDARFSALTGRLPS